jgi:hypothetical protein
VQPKTATQKLPDFIWKSLTWDQGKEMSNHLQIKVATGLQVYFCDPAAPGSEARTRTPTGCFGSTSLREPTSASTAPTISTSSPLR